MKINILKLCALLCICLSVSCRKEFDDHYESRGESTIKQNIVEILRLEPDFSLFVQAIDRLELATSLSESAIFTCLAPRNKEVELFAQPYGGIESVPEATLRSWLNYHFVMGMHYRYDLEKATDAYEPNSLGFFRSNVKKTRSYGKIKGKPIRLYTPLFLEGRAEDFRYLHNKSVSGFYAESAKISDRYDINASNGVIHVLDEPLSVSLRADQAIAADTNLSIINSWLQRYLVYNVGGLDNATGLVDTTRTATYTLSGGNGSADIADEGKQMTFIAPTNRAIRSFFGPYLGNFYNEYDSIPKSLVEPVLIAAFTNSFWGMSDMVSNPQSFVNMAFGYPLRVNKVQDHYVGGIAASNVNIYKVDVMLTPPVLNSVEGGIYINQDRYKNWAKMMAKGLNAGITDVLQYNHPDRTLLVQPDEVWTKLVDDYTGAQLDTLLWSLGSGILNVKVNDGKFERRYYPTSYGALLYTDGKFIDYKGQEARLLSENSTWTGTNGSIYEIDQMLNPLLTSDTLQNIYKMQLENSENYTLFRTACDVTGVTKKLKEVGYFNFTILAPTNNAFIDAGLGSLDMPMEELKALVERHIIQRKIFTDGSWTGRLNNLHGDMIEIAGSWENFSIRDISTGVTYSVIPEEANKQANNGVLHGMSKIIE